MFYVTIPMTDGRDGMDWECQWIAWKSNPFKRPIGKTFSHKPFQANIYFYRRKWTPDWSDFICLRLRVVVAGFKFIIHPYFFNGTIFECIFLGAVHFFIKFHFFFWNEFWCLSSQQVDKRDWNGRFDVKKFIFFFKHSKFFFQILDKYD